VCVLQRRTGGAPDGDAVCVPHRPTGTVVCRDPRDRGFVRDTRTPCCNTLTKSAEPVGDHDVGGDTPSI
jgi:hypothetical protein